MIISPPDTFFRKPRFPVQSDRSGISAPDLQEDPREMHSVYDDPEYADVRRDMHRRLKKIQKQYRDDDPDEKLGSWFLGADKL